MRSITQTHATRDPPSCDSSSACAAREVHCGSSNASAQICTRLCILGALKSPRLFCCCRKMHPKNSPERGCARRPGARLRGRRGALIGIALQTPAGRAARLRALSAILLSSGVLLVVTNRRARELAAENRGFKCYRKCVVSWKSRVRARQSLALAARTRTALESCFFCALSESHQPCASKRAVSSETSLSLQCSIALLPVLPLLRRSTPHTPERGIQPNHRQPLGPRPVATMASRSASVMALLLIAGEI